VGKESLQEVVISQSADMDSPIKRIHLNDVFWERVVSSLKPIAVAIGQIEGDNAILSDVHSACRCKRRNPYCPANFTVAPCRANSSSEIHQKA
jgi:hypothetical protein